jgi:protocatechuate 3,4-dioxygenase beta subunit
MTGESAPGPKSASMIAKRPIGRRRFLVWLAVGPLITGEAAAACRATERDMLGPFYVPDQPFQDDLCRGGGGERIAVSGHVMGLPDCRPLAGALVEVWQADARGEYTLVNRGQKPNPECLLRARLKSDEAGRYAFRSIVPGEYPGRPRHIHFRVSHSGFRTLVTQLYFKGDPGLDSAGSLAIELARNAGRDYSGVFDVVLGPAK